MTLRSERRSLAIQDAPQLEQVVEPGAVVECEEQAERAVQRVGRLRDDEGSTVGRDDHALGLEHPQRLADGGAPDAEALGQLALGREHVARPEPAAPDFREQLLCDLLVDLPALEGLVALSSLHSQRSPCRTSRRRAADYALRSKIARDRIIRL